jgi:hypothetical protein
MTVELGTSDSCWQWWQSRRLRYNLSLAAAGMVAYGLALALPTALRQPAWPSLQGGVAMTLYLGVGYLILMGVANVCYLVGPGLEALLRPADPGSFRRSAFALGFWGSVALPFAFPAMILAMLIGAS